MAEICGENFEIQCGEVFLHLLNGKLTFHCTLCESKYQHFQNYADHVASEHSPSMELDDELEENVVNDEISAYERNLDEKIKQEVPIKNENDTLAFEESSFNSFPEEYDTEDQELFNEDQEFFNEYEVGKEEVDDEAFVDMQFQDGPRKRGRKSKPEPVLIPTEDARPVKIKYINKNDDRKFRCPNCDFSCKLKRNLKGHLRRHAKEKPYPCKYCEKGFYTTTELKVHLRTHTGERPYSCEECGAGFITFAKLNEHRRVHSEKESHFECEDCGKIFSTPHRLRSHRAQHKKDELLETTKNPIYECALCNAQFLDRAYLNIHLQDEHMSVYI